MATRVRRRRVWLSRLSLAFAGAMIGWLAMEAAARFTEPAPPPRIRRPVPRGLPRLTTPRQLATPHIEGVFRGAYYRANSAGFRGREYSREKPAGVYRIVVVGDSFTMGHGVNEEETYASLLEADLNAGTHAERYEVLNLGLIGLNAWGVMARLQRIGLSFDPDLIVYGLTLNDIKGPLFRKSATGEAMQARRREYARFQGSPSHLLRLLWPRLMTLRELVAPWPGSLLFETRDNYFHNPPAWRSMLGALDQLSEISAARGVPAVVLVHTYLDYLNLLHPYREIYAAVGRAAAERGLIVIQSFPKHLGRNELELRVSASDGHPGAEGHRLLADSLLEGLERHHLGPWRSSDGPEQARASDMKEASGRIE